MPRVSFFYGIEIWMYWNEGSHGRPHFHVRYAGHKASINFDGEVVAGSLPPRVRRLAKTWALLHRPELEDNWRRAMRGEDINTIDPLP